MLLLLLELRGGNGEERPQFGEGGGLVRRAAGQGQPERLDGGVRRPGGEGGARRLVSLVSQARVIDGGGGGPPLLLLPLHLQLIRRRWVGGRRGGEEGGGVDVLGGSDGGVDLGHKGFRGGREDPHAVEHAPSARAAAPPAASKRSRHRVQLEGKARPASGFI